MSAETNLPEIVKADASLAAPSVQPPQDMEFQNMVTLAGMMAASGMFPNAKGRDQALTLMMLGREMGFTPVQSLNGLNVINGKPSLGANLMAAKVKGSGKYDYRVVQHTESACEIEFFERGEPVGRSAFTIADATTAGYMKNPQYKAAPKNMLFARAMSNGVKWYCPDVFGGVPVYHEGEIEVARALRGESTPQTIPPAASFDEKVRNAGLYFRRTIGGNAEQYAEFKAACDENQWPTVALDAERKGVLTFAGLMRFAKEGVVPEANDEVLDAEFSEADGPKGSSAPPAEKTPSGADATTGTSDLDKFRVSFMATLGDKKIQYVGDGKKAALAFLSESPHAPKGGYASTKEVVAQVWEERLGLLWDWKDGFKDVKPLDDYLAQQGSLSV